MISETRYNSFQQFSPTLLPLPYEDFCEKLKKIKTSVSPVFEFFCFAILPAVTMTAFVAHRIIWSGFVIGFIFDKETIAITDPILTKIKNIWSYSKVLFVGLSIAAVLKLPEMFILTAFIVSARLGAASAKLKRNEPSNPIIQAPIYLQQGNGYMPE